MMYTNDEPHPAKESVNFARPYLILIFRRQAEVATGILTNVGSVLNWNKSSSFLNC